MLISSPSETVDTSSAAFGQSATSCVTFVSRVSMYAFVRTPPTGGRYDSLAPPSCRAEPSVCRHELASLQNALCVCFHLVA